MGSDYDYPNVDWSALHEHYNATTDTVMKNRSLDALILVCRDNLRACADFRTNEQLELGGSIAEEFAAIIDRDGGRHVLAPWYPKMMKKTSASRSKEFAYVPSWSPATVNTDFWAREIGKTLRALKAKNIGFDHMSTTLCEKLKQEIDGLTLHCVFVDFLEARMIKHDEEMKLLDMAAAACDGATTAGLEIIKEGITEYQVAAQIARRVYEAGAESLSHIVLESGLGARPWPSAETPASRIMRRGDSVMFDVGLYWKGGYAADEARTGFIGKPDNAFKNGYNLMRDIVERTTKAMTPGRRASEIDSMLREPLLEAGYTDTPYANGHGVGLRLMELPQIDKLEFMANDYELKENMCICIEPETSVGDHRVKLENVILVRPGGGVSLNHTAFLEF